jgi:hypothetical protein
MVFNTLLIKFQNNQLIHTPIHHINLVQVNFKAKLNIKKVIILNKFQSLPPEPQNATPRNRLNFKELPPISHNLNQKLLTMSTSLKILITVPENCHSKEKLPITLNIRTIQLN